MATATKHKKRSMRSNKINKIPVGIFYAHAQKVYQAKQMKDTAKIDLTTQEQVNAYKSR